MLIQLLISGNKISDTKNNQTKGDLGLKTSVYSGGKSNINEENWKQKVNDFESSSFWNKNHWIHSLKL